ncbi:MAG: hypothetical protein Kilf2KO_44510 [Rhodospirillales bacterium]
MTIKALQPAFGAGEIGEELFGRIDLAKYASAVRLGRNVYVRPHGGLVNRPGTRFVAEAADSSYASRLIAFSFSTVQAYALEFGHQRMRVIVDGGLALEAAQPVESITQAQPAVVSVPGHGYSDGDEIVISGGLGMDEVKGDVFVVTGTTANTFTLLQKGEPGALNGAIWSAYQGGGSVARVYRLATPYAAEDLPALKTIQSADVLYLTHPAYDVRKLSRTGHTSWTLETVDFVPAIAAPGTPTATPTYAVAGSDTTYRYKVTAISDDTGEESLPSAEASCVNDLTLEGNFNTVGWAAVAGAARYEVYKEDNGVFGYAGGTEGLSLKDANITPDLSSTPPKAKNPFAGANDKPTAATFYEQRLFFAASTDRPQTLWGSASANFQNFGTRSILQADDSIEITLVARQVNAIRHLVAKEDLWALTSGGEWRIRGSDSEGYIAAGAPTPTRKISSWGAADVPPLEVGSSVVFVVEKGQGVRDLLNQIALEEFDVQEGSDLSILAPHLFEDRAVKAWAYAQTPHSLIWVVMDDGSLLSFTYYREHRVYAWTQHRTQTLGSDDGVFEDVVVVPEAREDVPYFTIKRTLNGQTKRYIERLPQRVATSPQEAFYLDSGLTYRGGKSERLLGLRHLEGRRVTALVDGQVVTGLTVAGGELQLPFAGSLVHVGLPYTATVRTLPLEIQLRDGYSNAKAKRLVRVVARVRHSGALWAGAAKADMSLQAIRTDEPMGSPADLHSGNVEFEAVSAWRKEADLWIEMRDPLPLEILSVTPEFALGR